MAHIFLSVKCIEGIMIKVRVSEVAAIIGKNPFEKQSDAIRNCIDRNLYNKQPIRTQRAQDATQKFEGLAMVSNNIYEGNPVEANTLMKKDIQSFVESQTKVVNLDESLDILENAKEQLVCLDRHLDILKNAEIDLKETMHMYDSIPKLKNVSKNLRYIQNEKKKMNKMKRDTRVWCRDLRSTIAAKKADIKAIKQSAKAVEIEIAHKHNTSYGIKHEDGVARSLEIPIVKTDELITHDLTPNIILRGRVDGVREDGSIVEIKKRTRRLFGVLKEYEAIQLQCYLNIMERDYGVLVEDFHGTKNSYTLLRNIEEWDEIKRTVIKCIQENLV